MEMQLKRRWFCAVLASSALLAIELRAAADVVSLPAVQDATLLGGTDAMTNQSLADPGIFVGTDGQDNPKRGLIEFNIAQYIPAGATITGETIATDGWPGGRQRWWKQRRIERGGDNQPVRRIAGMGPANKRRRLDQLRRDRARRDARHG